MSKRKRISFLETLESRKAFAHLGCEWTSTVESRSLASDEEVPSLVFNVESSPSFYVAMDVFVKGRGEPRDRSRGLVGEGEAGKRLEANRFSHETPVGSSSQTGRADQEPTLVIVLVQPATRQAPSQGNPSSARFENPAPIASIAVVQPGAFDGSRLAEANANGMTPFVQQEEKQARESPMASDRGAIVEVRTRSLLESLGWSNIQAPRTSDFNAALDQLMSDIGEDVYGWSTALDSGDDLDAGDVNRDRTSLLAKSTSGVAAIPSIAKSWETMYTQGLPIPSGMVHLQVGELHSVSIEKTRIAPQVASLSPSSFDLIQWFAGFEKEARIDPSAESIGDTKTTHRDSWSLRDGMTDVVFMIVAGGLATEGARRTRAWKRTFAGRLGRITLRRVGASRVQSPRLPRRGDNSFFDRR
ncbi:MAG: hypothetical protein MUD03_01485 [Pirellula sp.]|nr:hypothetical protein [Pirellula sp.]